MSAFTFAFFNNKGGVGMTTLVYNLAWMFALRGTSTLVVDLDPQSNVSSSFFEDDILARLWEGEPGQTVYSALEQRLTREGPLSARPLATEHPSLHLLAGDMRLSELEDHFALAWSKSSSKDRASFNVMGSIHKLIQDAADQVNAQLVFLDLGPSLGALNRAALLSADAIILPIAPDLFSLQGLKNLGNRIALWRDEWRDNRARANIEGLDLPAGELRTRGYVLSSFGVRDGREVKAYTRWMAQIPRVYQHAVLGAPADMPSPPIDQDPHCLARLKHFRSLAPMAMEARKPMFSLTYADGARGAHLDAVRACERDFQSLANTLWEIAAHPTG